MVRFADPVTAPEIVLVELLKVAVVAALIVTGLEILTCPFATIVPCRLTPAGKAAPKPLVKVVLPEVAELMLTVPRLLKVVKLVRRLLVPAILTL